MAQGRKIDNTLPRFVTRDPDGTYRAEVNRKAIRFFVFGFKTPGEAHEYAVERLRLEGQPVLPLRGGATAKQMSVAQRRDRRNVEGFRAEVKAARARMFVRVWNCCGCGAEYPLDAKPRQCGKCEHAAARRNAEVA